MPELLPAWEVQDGCWVSTKEMTLFYLLLGGTCTSYRAVWGGAEHGRTQPTVLVSEHKIGCVRVAISLRGKLTHLGYKHSS